MDAFAPRARTHRARLRSRIAGLGAVGLLATGLTTLATTSAAPAEAACSKAPSYKPGSTRFGVSLSTNSLSMSQSLAKQDSNFGRLKAVRIFDPGVPPSNAWSRRTSMLSGRTVVTSFRMAPQDVIAGKYDSAMRQFFSTAPTDRPIMWSYIHEPEPQILNGKFTYAQYRSAWQRLSTIAASYCRSNLFPTLILTGWTADPASHRDWRNYYPGSDFISTIAFDPYNSAHGTATTYRTPAQVFDNSVRVGKASGKPWGISETGSNRIPGDSAGYGRAAWLRSVATYLRAQGASYATYFQSTNNGDFELRDQPSISAWRSAVSGN